MIAANYTEFRTALKKYLDEVENNHETLIIKRGTGKGTVLLSLEEYNSSMETMHLLSSKTTYEYNDKGFPTRRNNTEEYKYE